MNESGTYKCEAVYSVNSVEKTVKSATAELYIRGECECNSTYLVIINNLIVL